MQRVGTKWNTRTIILLRASRRELLARDPFRTIVILIGLLAWDLIKFPVFQATEKWSINRTNFDFAGIRRRSLNYVHIMG